MSLGEGAALPPGAPTRGCGGSGARGAGGGPSPSTPFPPGELKDPSRAIPLGTIVAVAYTFFIYILLFFLSSFTCDRCLGHGAEWGVGMELSHLVPQVKRWLGGAGDAHVVGVHGKWGVSRS